MINTRIPDNETGKNVALCTRVNLALGTMNLALSNSNDNAQLASLYARFNKWQSRFDVYANDDRYKSFHEWQQSKKFNAQFDKFTEAVNAFNELNNIRDKTPPIQDIDAIKEMILEIIAIELGKLEINLQRQLQKKQRIPRISKSTIDEFNEKRKNLNSRIEIANHSKKFDGINTIVLQKFFLRHEKKIHFSKHFLRADKTSDALKFSTSGLDTFSTVGSTIVQATQGLATALSSIPVISSVVNAIPPIINAAKAWIQNKSTFKKTLATIGLGLALSGLGLAVAGAVISLGALTAAAAAGLILISTIIKYIAPYFKTHDKLERRTADLSFFNRRNYDAGLTELDHREKDILLKRIEEKWLNMPHNDTTKEQLNNAVKLIRAGNISDIDSKPNELLNEVMNNQKVSAFLKGEVKLRTTELKEEIKVLKADAKDKLIKSVFGVLGVVGALLFCIPTPVTMAIGAGLLATSAVASLALKYDIPAKIMGFFKNILTTIFGPKTNETNDAPTNSLKENLNQDTLPDTHNNNGPQWKKGSKWVRGSTAHLRANLMEEMVTTSKTTQTLDNETPANDQNPAFIDDGKNGQDLPFRNGKLESDATEEDTVKGEDEGESDGKTPISHP